MEKLHGDVRSKAAEVYYGCGRKCTPEEEGCVTECGEAMITFMEESARRVRSCGRVVSTMKR
jgi:hypothetical protein